MPKLNQNDSCRLAVQPIPPSPSSKKTQNWVKAMRRLAAGNVPTGGSPSRTQKHVKMHVLPGGYEQPAKRFLEIFQKTRKCNNQEAFLQFSMYHVIPNQAYKI